MRLLKVEFSIHENMCTVLIEFGRGFLSFIGLLEKSPDVHAYKVYDITVMAQMTPAQYGYGDCVKWELPDWALPRKKAHEANED